MIDSLHNPIDIQEAQQHMEHDSFSHNSQYSNPELRLSAHICSI